MQVAALLKSLPLEDASQWQQVVALLPQDWKQFLALDEGKLEKLLPNDANFPREQLLWKLYAAKFAST